MIFFYLDLVSLARVHAHRIHTTVVSCPPSYLRLRVSPRPILPSSHYNFDLVSKLFRYGSHVMLYKPVGFCLESHRCFSPSNLCASHLKLLDLTS